MITFLSASSLDKHYCTNVFFSLTFHLVCCWQTSDQSLIMNAFSDTDPLIPLQKYLKISIFIYLTPYFVNFCVSFACFSSLSVILSWPFMILAGSCLPLHNVWECLHFHYQTWNFPSPFLCVCSGLPRMTFSSPLPLQTHSDGICVGNHT